MKVHMFDTTCDTPMEGTLEMCLLKGRHDSIKDSEVIKICRQDLVELNRSHHAKLM